MRPRRSARDARPPMYAALLAFQAGFSSMCIAFFVVRKLEDSPMLSLPTLRGARPELLQPAQNHRLRSLAGQRLLVARVVYKCHPHLDDLAVVGCLDRVADVGVTAVDEEPGVRIGRRNPGGVTAETLRAAACDSACPGILLTYSPTKTLRTPHRFGKCQITLLGRDLCALFVCSWGECL